MSSSAITGPVFSDVKRSPSGSAAAPSWSFNESTGTGIYLVSAGVLGLSTNGVQRVVVDASGSVGIGTASPTAKLEVKDSTTNCALSVTNANSTLQLQSNSNDGYLNMIGTGATIFRSGSPVTERMRIDASGNLLVGKTAVSTTTLGGEIRPGGGLTVTSAATTNGSTTLEVYSTGAGNFRFYVGLAGTVFATNTTITGISDERLKENIRDLDDGLDVVLALKPRKFDWKEGKGKDIKDDRGFIAQEFEQVFPDMIQEWKDPAPEGEEPYKAVNANLIPTLVKAIQEQQEIIGKLEARLAALEAK